MKDYIEERVIELARYILETNATVRATAKKFRVSKSTVHIVLSIGVGYYIIFQKFLTAVKIFYSNNYKYMLYSIKRKQRS